MHDATAAQDVVANTLYSMSNDKDLRVTTVRLPPQHLSWLDERAAAMSPTGVPLSRSDVLRHLVAKAMDGWTGTLPSCRSWLTDWC